MNVPYVSYEKHIEVIDGLIAEVDRLREELAAINTNAVESLILERTTMAASEAWMAKLLRAILISGQPFNQDWRMEVYQVLWKYHGRGTLESIERSYGTD